MNYLLTWVSLDRRGYQQQNRARFKTEAEIKERLAEVWNQSSAAIHVFINDKCICCQQAEYIHPFACAAVSDHQDCLLTAWRDDIRRAKAQA